MVTEQDLSHLSSHSRQAVLFYEESLKSTLEPEHNGEAIAIDTVCFSYEIAPSHKEAARALRRKLVPNGRIVTLTIGPPTASDISIASRILGSAAYLEGNSGAT